MHPQSGDPGLEPNRREVLSLAWLGAMGLVIVQAGTVLARILPSRDPDGEPGEWIHVAYLHSAKDWPTPLGRPLSLRNGAWLVLEDDGVRALRGGCSRESCRVAHRPEAGGFLCLCCGSRFGLDGRRLGGLAKKPLEGLALRTKVEGEASYRYAEAGQVLRLESDRLQQLWLHRPEPHRQTAFR